MTFMNDEDFINRFMRCRVFDKQKQHYDIDSLMWDFLSNNPTEKQFKTFVQDALLSAEVLYCLWRHKND